MSVEQTLSIVVQTVGNAYLSRKIAGMRESAGRGGSILETLGNDGRDRRIHPDRAADGLSRRGPPRDRRPDDEVGDLYTNEVQYELKTLGRQIEPIMITLLGLMWCVLALSVFLPMWDLGRVALKR